jgi:hypothetical protein
MRRRTLLLAMLVLLVVPAVAGFATAAGRGSMEGAAAATAVFHDLDKAVAAGWNIEAMDLSGATCIAEPGEGAMGVHMVNGALLTDGTIDPQAPEALVYERRNDGTLKLVALEYIVFEAAWTGAAPPELFGQQFDYIGAGNRYGLPPFYALHAWIWKPNPSGLLYPWNPNVDCG